MAPKSEADKQAEVINHRQVEIFNHERLVNIERAMARYLQEARDERREARKERQEVREELRAFRAELAELTLIVHQVANQQATALEHQEEYSTRTDTFIVSTGSAFEGLRTAMYESRDKVLDALPSPGQTVQPDRQTVRSQLS